MSRNCFPLRNWLQLTVWSKGWVIGVPQQPLSPLVVAPPGCHPIREACLRTRGARRLPVWGMPHRGSRIHQVWGRHCKTNTNINHETFPAFCFSASGPCFAHNVWIPNDTDGLWSAEPKVFLSSFCFWFLFRKNNINVFFCLLKKGQKKQFRDTKATNPTTLQREGLIELEPN